MKKNTKKVLLEAFSKEELIEQFKEIYTKGWIFNYRRGNDGAVGNILEDLLGIPENNLPIANAAEWELKAQRSNSNSLLTLFHKEPSPTALKIVSTRLLPLYGWQHKQAGTKYPADEKSFRATLNAQTPTDRGIKIVVNDQEQRIEVNFNALLTSQNHRNWLEKVKATAGHLNNFDIIPYWRFDDLYHKAGTKLHNCFYVQADVKHEKTDNTTNEYFRYNYVLKLSHFDKEKFINAIRDGKIYIDFDARTGHNHGTKFRIKHQDIPTLYQDAEVIIDNREKADITNKNNDQ